MDQDKPSLLYVDDTKVNLILFQDVFTKDFDIVLTEFPEEALKILEEREIHVIVTDQQMPKMTGTELLEIVAEKYPNIRRYLLTAYTDAETVIEAINVGRVHGYISKPFNADEIRASINSSIEIYELREKNEIILKELEIANAELLNLDGLKSEIINSIINEISMPLNRIMGTLHLLKSKIEGDELSDVVNILDQSVLKLEQFSILARQISELKSPGFCLESQQISLNQLIQFSAIETVEELKELGIVLKRDATDDLQIKGNSDLLVSSLVNLIRFAREHTSDNEDITISTTSGNGGVVCLVEDGGNGYTEPFFELLTNQYSAKETVLNLDMGIGLAVSQMIMESHGGHLVFEKTERGKGKMKMLFPNE